MTGKRFGMYQNILYDDGEILNPFDAMKLLNYFDKENTKLKEENEQLKQPNCRKCIHFACDSADNYCINKKYDSIDLSDAKNCKDYRSVFE